LKIELLKSKIHRATVTGADLDYVGSITLDETLMDSAGLYEYEKVHILNISNGNRLETYVIRGAPDSGAVCINGAAAHLVSKGDLIIIASYCSVEVSNLDGFFPSIVHVNKDNEIIS
jgi:aspartate 1-decarboxylase